MKKTITVISILILLAPLFAKDEAIRLTIYNRGVAQVCLVRQYKLEKGDNWLIIDDISPQIMSETTFFKPLKDNKNITVTQGDFLYAPYDLDGLWKGQVGKWITISVAEEPFWGLLLSFDDTYFYMMKDDGTLKLLERSSVDNSTFTEIPQGLAPHPTLKYYVNNKGKSKAVDFEIGYLTTGISWTAYYFAHFAKGKVELSGDFILDNKLEMGFDGAELSLIAGDPHLAGDREILPRNEDMTQSASAPSEGNPLFAYYNYPVTMKVDLPPMAKKKIPLLESKTYPAEERYVMKSGFGYRNLETTLVFKAPEIPLPEGKIGVYIEDDEGRSQFMGEDKLHATPPGGEVEITVGQAFDLQGERKRISHRRLDRNITEDVIRVNLMNGSDKDVEIIVRERMYGVWEIIDAVFNDEPVTADEVDSRRADFKLTLKAKSNAILQYTVRYEF